ncbi:MAG: hypothetical protein AB1746_05230 [Candidatus Zixiibacteriota bacterium]
MVPEHSKIDYSELKNHGTGSHGESEDFKIVTYPIDKYEIVVKLSSDGKFIGIVAIKINKDFIQQKQLHLLKGYHDVEEFYKE